MKKLTVFFISFFLFSFVGVTLAAEIKVEDASTTDTKSVIVSVDTGTETTGNIKAVIEHSDDVTITDVTESDVSCSTFSYVPTNNRTEIICTLSTSKVVKGTVAEIKFTSDSENYQFKIIREETIIGDLKVERISNMGNEDVLDASTEADTGETNTELTDTQTELSTPTNTTTSSTKTEGIMAYLPYILLGVAGIFFVSMVILVLTKKKNDVVLTDLPASAAVASTSTEPQPTAQPQQPVNFDNIPEHLQNQTMQDNILSQKPTLEEIVNQSPTEVPSTNFAEPIPSSPITTGINEQEDLEALLKSENPGIPSTTPAETTSTTPITGLSQQTEQFVNENEVAVNQSVTPMTNMVANISQPEQQMVHDASVTVTPSPISTELNASTPIENTIGGIPPLEPITNNQPVTPTPMFTKPTTSMPIENTVGVVSQPEQPADNGALDDSFDFSKGGLPTIGSLDPINQTTIPNQEETEIPASVDMGQQSAMMPPVETVSTENNIDNDLQNIVNEEINGIANIGSVPTDENAPTTQI